MLEWVMRVADRVDALVKADPEYQELDKQRKALEPDYEALLARLSEKDRELVGNMQYRTTQFAWLYGKQHPNG